MRLIERRIGLLFAAFLLCFLVILGRAFWVQGVKGPALASEAAAQQTDVVTVPGLRGSLLDRHGNELAASEDAATIYATPYQVKNPPRTADKLAPILGLNANAVLRSLTANSGFSYVAHKVDMVTAAKVAALKLPGIGQLPDSQRTYPQGQLAAQVLGAVGAESQGLTGLEAGENSVLHGTDGERRIVNDALGEPIRLDTVSQASDGQNVQLTLDPAIQAKTERVLDEVGAAYQPKGATAIVMDPRNSQVLAMANWPPVSLEDLSSTSPEDLENRATGFTYEPGSTFKAFTVSAALEDKLVTPETLVHPAAEYPGRRPHDLRRRGPPDRHPQHRSDPRPVLQRRRGHDRAAGRQRAVQPLDRPLRLRPPDRRPVPRRGARDRAGAAGLLRVDDGQPADRPGAVGDADADDRRLRGDRQRRHPAPSAAGREGRRHARTRAAWASRNRSDRRLPGADHAGGSAGAGRAPPRR